MPQSEGPYAVGQEVEVSYRARVAEVVAGRDEGVPPLLRLEALQSHDYSSPPGGWLSPAKVSVKVIAEALPTTPGMYYMQSDDPRQEHMGAHHTDGHEFHYLNHQGNWVDVGWGQPHHTDAPKLKGPLKNRVVK
jgi:hypothetical protein